jgi:hypothetical protein
LYANMQRSARTLLEERGVLSPRQKRRNGAAWIFWAQEPDVDAGKKEKGYDSENNLAR